jgi:hypothetical protein
MSKLHSPRHQDDPGAVRNSKPSLAPRRRAGRTTRPLPPATNHTAPLQAGPCAAVRETEAVEESGNGVTAGGGIAGIAETAGVPRPGEPERTVLHVISTPSSRRSSSSATRGSGASRSSWGRG